jgi:hypothetical protein
MPNPIQSDRSPDRSLQSHYDERAGLCAVPSTNESSASAPASSFPDYSGAQTQSESPRAVQELVATQASRSTAQQVPLDRDCFTEVTGAALTCGITAGAALLGTATGPGDLVIIAAGGAKCATDVINAYECVTGKP